MTNMPYPKHRPRHYNVAEAKARFSTLVRKALEGEEVVIARDNKPLVKLVPIAVVGRRPGTARGLVRMSADFDRTPADFDPYL
jgi:prevent-host-death family protein